MPFAVATLVVFSTLEVGQHIVKTPALTAQVTPAVKVFTLTAHIEHGVDGTGPTQSFATRLVAAATIQTHLGCGFKCPVVDFERLARQHERGCHRGAYEHIASITPRLQQAHIALGICAQAVGQGGASGAAAHNHIVKLGGGHPMRAVRNCKEKSRKAATPLSSARLHQACNSKANCARLAWVLSQS